MLVALVGLVLLGGGYLAGYGEHHYSCNGMPLPCLSYSKVEDPSALMFLAVFAAAVGFLLTAAAWRIRRPSRRSGALGAE